MNLQSIREQRAGVVAQMRALLVTAETAKRELTAAEAAEFDRLKTEERGLADQAARAEALLEAERRASGTPAGGDRNFDAECRSFSLLRAIQAQLPNSSVDAGREREVSQELARRSGRSAGGLFIPSQIFEERVFTTTNPAGGPGSNLVPTDHRADQYIDRLRDALIVRRLGATVLSGLTGNVDIPRLRASVAAAWVLENAALTANNPQVEKITLTPKHVGALTEYSRNMVQQTSPDIEALLRNDFAQILAAEVDRAAINGAGAAGVPRGILQTAGIGSVAMGANGGPIAWSSVIDLVGAVEIANAQGAAFMTNARVTRNARRTVKVASTDSEMVMDAPAALAGYPVGVTNLVPSNLTKGTSVGVCSALIFGDFSQLLLGYWSEFDLLVNPYESAAYAKGNVQIRGMLTMDVAVRQPAAFAAIQDLTTP